MPDIVTETTSQSWFGRIGDSIKGVLFGFVIFLIGFPMLGYNEYRSVIDFKAFKEGRGAVVSGVGRQCGWRQRGQAGSHERSREHRGCSG